MPDTHATLIAHPTGWRHEPVPFDVVAGTHHFLREHSGCKMPARVKHVTRTMVPVDELDRIKVCDRCTQAHPVERYAVAVQLNSNGSEVDAALDAIDELAAGRPGVGEAHRSQVIELFDALNRAIVNCEDADIGISDDPHGIVDHLRTQRTRLREQYRQPAPADRYDLIGAAFVACIDSDEIAGALDPAYTALRTMGMRGWDIKNVLERCDDDPYTTLVEGCAHEIRTDRVDYRRDAELAEALARILPYSTYADLLDDDPTTTIIDKLVAVTDQLITRVCERNARATVDFLTRWAQSVMTDDTAVAVFADITGRQTFRVHFGPGNPAGVELHELDGGPLVAVGPSGLLLAAAGSIYSKTAVGICPAGVDPADVVDVIGALYEQSRSAEDLVRDAIAISTRPT